MTTREPLARGFPYMAYQTYITEALVCGGWHSNTADRSILLFAREAGMVYVQAKSIREERSKQRYALQDASHVRATLIRGKTGWKVAGAESIQSFYASCDTRESRACLRNVILLLRRVVQGEGSHQHLFDDVIAGLKQSHFLPIKSLETVLSLRILNALGYVASLEEYEHLLGEAFPSAEVEKLSDILIQKCAKVIEHGLIQSQL